MATRSFGPRLLALCICVWSVVHAADDKPPAGGKSANDENSCQININIIAAGLTEKLVPMTVHFPTTFWDIVRQVMRNREKMFPGSNFDIQRNTLVKSYDEKYGSKTLTKAEKDSATLWKRHSAIAERFCDGKYHKNGPIGVNMQLSLLAHTPEKPVKIHVRAGLTEAGKICDFTPVDWKTVGEMALECLQEHKIKIDGLEPIVVVERDGGKRLLSRAELQMASRMFFRSPNSHNFYGSVVPKDKVHHIHLNAEIYRSYRAVKTSGCTVAVLAGEPQTGLQIAQSCHAELALSRKHVDFPPFDSKSWKLHYGGKETHDDKRRDYLFGQSKRNAKIAVLIASNYKVEVNGKLLWAAVFPETTIGDVAKQLNVKPKRTRGKLTGDVLLPSDSLRRFGRPYNKDKLKADGKPYKALVTHFKSYIRINGGKLEKGHQ